MEKKDGRALPHAVREEIRKRAIARVMSGESPELVIEALGFLETPVPGTADVVAQLATGQ